MNILITGGCGYIGSVLCEKLSRNHQVIIYDQKKSYPKTDNNPNLVYARGSILNKWTLNKIFKKYKIDLVIHLAAKISVSESMKHPFMYHRNNVTGTKNIMHVMKKYHCNNIIFASSAAVYGDVSKIPINESDPLKPCNPYGLSKMKDEHIIQNANIKYFIFRLFNVSGASDSHLHGIDNENPQSLIAAVNKKIMNNQTPVIYGDKYKTNDGTCFRDYIHVEDVVNAFMNIIKHIDTLPSGIFNLGSGQGYTVLDIIKLACELHGVPLSYEIKNNRGGDPSNLLADISLSKNILDWTPQHSLRDMITSDMAFRKKV